MYVTGGHARRLKDFILLQEAGAKFSIGGAPSDNQKNLARSIPVSEIIVIRADYNGDGLYDYQFADVDTEIDEANDFILTTKFNSGAELSEIIPINDSFNSLMAGIEDAIQYPDTYLGLYYNDLSVCRNVSVRYLVWDPYVYNPYTDSYGDWVIITVVYRVCENGKEFLEENISPERLAFVESLAAMDQKFGLNGFQGAPSAIYDSVMEQIDPRQVLRTATAARRSVQILRTGSIIATTVLLADDISVIGIADDVGLIGTLGTWGITILAEVALDEAITILEQAIEDGNEDVGEQDYVSVGAGTYAISSNCKPEHPDQESSEGLEPTSERLRDNLKIADCWCDQADVKSAAHHIVRKSGGGTNGEALRQCLKGHNIDIDSAVNGVCLPMKKTKNSDAFKHAGKENTLHGPKVVEKLLTACQNKSREEFVEYLRQTAGGYTKGIPPL